MPPRGTDSKLGRETLGARPGASVIRIEGIQKDYGRGDAAVRVLRDGSLRVETRSGNLAKPDSSWSGWPPLQGLVTQPATDELAGKPVATKVGGRVGTQARNSVGSSRGYLISAIDASLKRLGRDHVDLFQLHNSISTGGGESFVHLSQPAAYSRSPLSTSS